MRAKPSKFHLRIVWVAILLCAAGCGAQPNTIKQFETALRSASERLSSGTQFIKLSSLTTFAWDEAFCFEPYTLDSSIIKLIPAAAGNKAVSNAAINARDDINLMVFLKDGQVSQVLEVHRSIADIQPVGQSGPFTNSDAVIKRGDGSNALSLTNQAD